MRTEPRTRSEVVYNFWQNVRKTDKCWLWIAGTTKAGYGTFRWDGTNYYAHRFSAELAGLDIVDKTVLHKCDTPNCVNPDCFIIGTDADNVKDKVSKGRQSRGETHGMSKLTDEETRDVKFLLSIGIFQKTIAAKYGVDQSLISKIKNGVTRSHTKVLV